MCCCCQAHRWTARSVWSAPRVSESPLRSPTHPAKRSGPSISTRTRPGESCIFIMFHFDSEVLLYIYWTFKGLFWDRWTLSNKPSFGILTRRQVQLIEPIYEMKLVSCSGKDFRGAEGVQQFIWEALSLQSDRQRLHAAKDAEGFWRQRCFSSPQWGPWVGSCLPCFPP